MISIGHRGAAGHEPENTIRSIRRALELGADWVEIDVYPVEGELVVIHDDRLDRTTNGSGRVVEQTLDYVRSLDAGKGERVPLLGEVFDAVEGRAGVNVQMQCPQATEPVAEFVAGRVSRGWSYERILVSSFEHLELKRLRELDPRILIGALVVAVPVTLAAFAEELGAYSLNPFAQYLTDAFVADARRRGLKVFPYTVNHPDDIQRMAALGVDGVFTDYPERVGKPNAMKRDETL